MIKLVARVKAAVVIVAAAVALLVGSAAPANAMVVYDLDLSLLAICDSGYRTIVFDVGAIERDYDGVDSTLVHYWTVGVSHNGSSWQEAEWQQRVGTFHETYQAVPNAAPGVWSFYIRSWSALSGDQSEYAYHQARYMGGYITDVGASCQM